MRCGVGKVSNSLSIKQILQEHWHANHTGSCRLVSDHGSSVREIRSIVVSSPSVVDGYRQIAISDLNAQIDGNFRDQTRVTQSSAIFSLILSDIVLGQRTDPGAYLSQLKEDMKHISVASGTWYFQNESSMADKFIVSTGDPATSSYVGCGLQRV
jgi:hypothetical protein